MTEQPTLLSTEDLTKRFGGISAVDQVTFELSPGHTKALIGPNGAGKTTLLNCLSGLEPVTGGRIYIRGDDVTHLPPDRRAWRGLGRTFQITNLFDGFTTFENIRLAAQIKTVNNANFWNPCPSYTTPREIAEEILEQIGLTDQRRTPVAALSHGEKRQLEIGLALATQPDILLLDEPTAGMGSDEVTEITSLISELGNRYAIVLVEHNIDLVMNISDSVMVLDQGTLIADGPPETVSRDETVRQAYLGTEEDRFSVEASP